MDEAALVREDHRLDPVAAGAGSQLAARSGMLRLRMPGYSELLLAGFEAWNRDDCEAWIALLDPEIEIRTSGVFPDLAPDYRGHERAAKFWRQLREPWEVFRIDVERVEEEGDCVAAAIRFRAQGVDSGVKVDMRFGSAIRVRDGLAVELVNRRTFDEARKALRPSGRGATGRLTGSSAG